MSSPPIVSSPSRENKLDRRPTEDASRETKQGESKDLDKSAEIDQSDAVPTPSLRPSSPQTSIPSRQSSRGRHTARPSKPTSRHSSQYSDAPFAVDMDFFDPYVGFYGPSTFGVKDQVELPSASTDIAVELPAELPQEFEIVPTYYPPPPKRNWSAELDRSISTTSPDLKTAEWLESQAKQNHRKSVGQKSSSSISPITTPNRSTPVDPVYPAPLAFQSRAGSAMSNNDLAAFSMANVPTFHPPDSKNPSTAAPVMPSTTDLARPPNNRHSISQPLTYTYTYAPSNTIPPISEGIPSSQHSAATIHPPIRASTIGPQMTGPYAPPQTTANHRQSISVFPPQVQSVQVQYNAIDSQAQLQPPTGQALPQQTNQFNAAQMQHSHTGQPQFQPVQLQSGQIVWMPISQLQNHSIQQQNPQVPIQQGFLDQGVPQNMQMQYPQQVPALHLETVQFPSGQTVSMPHIQSLSQAQPAQQQFQIGPPLQQVQSAPQILQQSGSINAIAAGNSASSTAVVTNTANDEQMKKLKKSGMKALGIGAKVAFNVGVRAALSQTIGIDPGNILRVTPRPQAKAKQSATAANPQQPTPAVASLPASTQAAPGNQQPAIHQTQQVAQQPQMYLQSQPIQHLQGQQPASQPQVNQQGIQTEGLPQQPPVYQPGIAMQGQQAQQSATQPQAYQQQAQMPGQQPAQVYQQAPLPDQLPYYGDPNIPANAMPNVNQHPMMNSASMVNRQQFYAQQQSPSLLMQDLNHLGMQMAQTAMSGGFSGQIQQQNLQNNSSQQWNQQLQTQTDLYQQGTSYRDPTQQQQLPDLSQLSLSMDNSVLSGGLAANQPTFDPTQYSTTTSFQQPTDLLQLSISMDNSAMSGGLAANAPTYIDPSQYWNQQQQQQQYQYQDPDAFWSQQQADANTQIQIQQGLLATQTADDTIQNSQQFCTQITGMPAGDSPDLMAAQADCDVTLDSMAWEPLDDAASMQIC